METLFSRVRNISKTSTFMHYNRLALLIVLSNAVYFLKTSFHTREEVLRIVLINFFFAMVVRQHYVINLFFKIATSIPHSIPLKVRAFFGKVYHFGGIHVGGSISATLWYFYYITKIEKIDINFGISLISFFVMVTIIFFAFNRHQMHDIFERVTRFGSWVLQGLIILQSILIFKELHGNLEGYFGSLEFFLLVLLTFNIILPWLTLRKVSIKIETPSNHVAIAQFDYGVTPFAGSSTSLSLDPLFEWHSFANIPTPGMTGFRLAISRAGDWTSEFIEKKPKHVWVKAIPTAGVGNIEKLFKRVIFVATGSGIGPCLPHLLANEVPSRIIWSTRSPERTYGEDLVAEVKRNHKDAIIWDTNKHGKPDLLELAYQTALEFDAEAIICISNKKLTWKVVTGLEQRGMHAYGAIFDS